MRDRLIGLYCKTQQMRMMRQSVGECVDYLLANGVIALPLEIGDVVYSYSTEFDMILPYKIDNIIINDEATQYGASLYYDNILRDAVYFEEEEIGSLVYLTKQEAEKALERGV